MKFAWKVTLCALAVMILAVGVGSYAMITLSFRSSLEREINVAQEELQMLRTSCEALCGVRGVTVENLDVTGRSLGRALQESPYFSDHLFRLSDTEGPLYSTLSHPGEPELIRLAREGTAAYVVTRGSGGDKVLIRCAGPVVLTDGVLSLETVRDISSIYASRETHYTLYRWILLGVMTLGGGLMLLLSALLTRPIHSLEQGSRRIAGGDLTSRVEVGGSDEIAALAQEFNRMADTVEANVQALEQAARKQEDFTASFVHELKTPLTSIIGYADLLRSQVLPEEMRFKAASYIFSEGKRLEKLSLSLMTLLVVGHNEEELTEIPVQRLTDGVCRTAVPAMKAKDVRLEVEVEPAVLQGDLSLLETLLLNLLDNARKASEAGASVALRGEKAGTGYRFEVEDHGRGIPEADLRYITEPFYMADKSRSRAEGGAGLGLALCRRIVELHRGTMTFRSREGEGTTVTVILGGGENA